MFQARNRLRSAFTLIELLVVIAIIAVLIGLLLPGVQKVREAAARTRCQNNLHQIGVSFHSFHDQNGFMPTAGNDKSGNPACNRKDWGWTYEILPFIEQSALYNLPSDSVWTGDTATQVNGTSDGKLRKTPVSTYNCPSRRSMTSANPPKSDYAGNGGSRRPTNDWFNGVVVTNRGSGTSGGYAVKMTDIPDGTSNTIMVAEKVINQNPNTNDFVDNESWAGPGADGDIMRGCVAHATTAWCGPMKDFNDPTTFPGGPNYGTTAVTVMDQNLNFRFGSAHHNGMQAIFGDGSVRSIRYAVDPALFMRTCVRNDGGVVDLDGL